MNYLFAYILLFCLPQRNPPLFFGPLAGAETAIIISMCMIGSGFPLGMQLLFLGGRHCTELRDEEDGGPPVVQS